MTDTLDYVDIPVPDTEFPDGHLTDEIAALMVARIAAHTRRINRAEGIAKALIEAEAQRVNDWLGCQTWRDRKEAAQLEERLEAWILGVRSRSAGRVKSRAFPHGTVRTREVGGGWRPTDEAALLAWAREKRPEWVRVAESFAVADAKRALTAVDGVVVDPATGEVVPGLAAEPKGVRASVVLGGES